MPLVSVIIVNFNGWARLRPCLEALAATLDVAFETIVVDNGSTDESAAQLRAQFPAVQLIQLESNEGFGAANHVGIAAAAGEYIALLNNDTEVEPDWLRELLTCLQADPQIGAACSRLLLLQDPRLSERQRWRHVAPRVRLRPRFRPAVRTSGA
jgi:GT2 family glycosyltransferase